MVPALTPADLQRLYDDGAQLLFPGAHAARVWGERLSGATRAHNGLAPLTWREWLQSLWFRLLIEGHEDRTLLNAIQEEQLWTECIADELLSASFVRDLATLARSAWQQAAELRIGNRITTAADTTDARTYSRWVGTFLARCDREGLLSPSLLEEVLRFHLAAGAVELPPALYLVGFPHLTPAQEALVAALQQCGTAVHRHPVTRSAGDSERKSVVFRASDEELRSAVLLLRDAARNGSASRFALLVPSPAAERASIERQLRELLAPELDSLDTDPSATPWLFASRPPLARVPVVRDALDLLRWCQQPLALHEVERLVLSPYLRHADSFESRARFDLRSTRRNRSLHPSLSLAEVERLPASPVPAANPGDEPALREFRSLAKAFHEAQATRHTRTYSDWVEVFRKLLRSVGWPGEEILSSLDTRAAKAWEGCLDMVATLQLRGQRTSFAAALEAVLRCAEEASVPPLTFDAPVQVLTLEEAQGLTFDVAILLGATDRNLPSPRQRHPLLSQTLQRKLKIGDASRAYDETRDQLQRLASAASRALLFASTSEGDVETQLTPLAEALGFVPMEASAVAAPPAAHSPVPLETVDTLVRLPPLPSAEVSGGADVLRQQAACGFQAFSTYRLAAADRPSRALGIDFRQAGNLLHVALELLWGNLSTSAALKNLTDSDKRDRIAAAVAGAFARERLNPGTGVAWDERYLHVLARRFCTVLWQWLEQEAKRSAFTVLAQEERRTLEVGPLRLSVRPDRLDEVEGGVVLVDYKSGVNLSPKHWQAARPEAPQLPAYALLQEPERLRGIAFAQIRPGKDTGWISLTDDETLFPSKRRSVSDMAGELESWRSELTRLAHAFADGDASVDPKNFPHTCTFCGVRSLCRLDPATLSAEAPDESEDGAEELRGNLG